MLDFPKLFPPTDHWNSETFTLLLSYSSQSNLYNFGLLVFFLNNFFFFVFVLFCLQLVWCCIWNESIFSDVRWRSSKNFIIWWCMSIGYRSNCKNIQIFSSNSGKFFLRNIFSREIFSSKPSLFRNKVIICWYIHCHNCQFFSYCSKWRFI